MNAIQFLIQEHDKVRRIFADIADNSHREETKQKMFADLCHELIRHETMEQEIWYPNFKNNPKLDDTVKHLIIEEKNAEKTIKSFSKVKNFAEWEKMFLDFKKDVEHHAKEEETKLFPHVEKLLDETTLEEIGKNMREFKKEFNEAVDK